MSLVTRISVRASVRGRSIRHVKTNPAGYSPQDVRDAYNAAIKAYPTGISWCCQ